MIPQKKIEFFLFVSVVLSFFFMNACSDLSKNGATSVLDSTALLNSSASVISNPALSSGAIIPPGSSALLSQPGISSGIVYSSGTGTSSVGGSSTGTSSVGTSSTGVSSTGTSSAVSSSSAVNLNDPLANITKDCGSMMPAKVSGGLSGWGSRYWDCCKPSCAWRENVDTSANPFLISKTCNVNDEEMASFVISPNSSQYWQGYEGTSNACDAGGEGYTCTDNVPFAVCKDLAYGYAAVPPDGNTCGKCYQLDFDGGAHNGDVKQAHLLMAGKTMIVMASNVGADVGSGQFDIMIPGGGVGMYNGGCSVQWGVDASDENTVGKRYGGFTSKCQESLGWDAPVSSLKECVRGMCDNLFGSKPEMANLLTGCYWYVDWMNTVDNPTFKYKEVPCPQELVDGYRSNINTTKDLPFN